VKIKKTEGYKLYYRTYRELYDSWSRNNTIDNEDLERLLELFEELVEDDKKLIMFTHYTDLVECYKTPEQLAERASLKLEYIKNMNRFKIWLLKTASLLFLISLSIITTYIVIKYIHEHDIDIISYINQLFAMIGVWKIR